MKKKVILASICLIAISSLAWVHPYYVTISQIDYNSSNESLEISMKMFTDDLENALNESGAGKLHLGEVDESEKADTYIGRYIAKQMEISVNGVPVKLSFLGKEVDMDVTWCYVEVLEVPTPQNMDISNRMFMEMFDTQVNIVHVNLGQKEKSALLNKGKSSANISFE